MKKNYILLLTLLISSLSFGQIFITELADPSDATTCRYVELYNAGATDVDLGAAGYKIQRYTNGNASPQAAVPLTGTITAGGFFIIGRSGFSGCYGFSPDMSLASGLASDSNGDDQIQILDNLDAVVDIFGVPGEDGTGTCHDFLDGRAERIASVTTGNSGTWDESKWSVTGDASPTGCTDHTTGTIATTDGTFDPGAWIGAPVTNTEVAFVSAASSTTEGVGTFDICVAITNPDGANATTVDIVMNMSSTATNGSDFTMITFPQTLTFPAGSSTNECLTITLTDDMITESTETIVLDLQNPGGGNSAVLGTGVQHTVTIAPSDVQVPNVGDIIITEIMQNPNAVSDSNGEYFEVYNTTGSPIDMLGWELTDPNSSTFLNNEMNGTITNSTIVPANGYLVLAANGDALVNGGIMPDYNFDGSGTGLFNGAGSLTLTAGSTIIDDVSWDGGPNFPDPTGASMELSINHYNATDNDNGAAWCTAVSSFGDGDLGTPGAVNDCSATLSIGLNEIEGFMVYPNPINRGSFKINSSSRANKSIHIYDILGKQVLNKSVKNEELINVSHLNTGIYILKVSEEGKLATRKLVIE